MRRVLMLLGERTRDLTNALQAKTVFMSHSVFLRKRKDAPANLTFQSRTNCM